MKQAIAFLLMVFSLTAISSFAEERGGVGVGNGRSVFKSEAGFSVTYADSLTLAVHSPSEFTISNVRLVKASEKVSKIEFTATRGKVKNVAEAEALFRERHPGKEIRYLWLKGAQGLAHEERTRDRLFGIYYVVTSNGDFVEITLEAYAFGNGMELIAPIVGTFTYDLTRPVFHHVEASPGPWRAGSRQWLRLRITDDNSGVNASWASAFLHRYTPDGKREPIYVDSFGPLKPEGDDWYRLDLEVGKFLPPGEYTLQSVTVHDNATNVGSVWTENPSEGLYRGPEGQPRLEIVKVEITNSGRIDVRQPEILELRMDKRTWKAGTWNKLYIRARDDVSGINVRKIECGGLESVEAYKGGAFRTKECRNPKHERGDWYSIEMLAGKFLPSAEYFLPYISVQDNASHGLSLSNQNGQYETYRDGKKAIWGPVVRVQVRNDGRADVTPPMIHEIRVDSNVWKTGTTQRLYFRATDDLSGVAVGTNTYGYIVPVEKKEERRALYPDRAIHHLGGDWYYTEVQVNAYLEGGEYYLSGLSFHDRAWNNAGIACWMGDLEPAPCKNKNGPEIPRLHIRIER